MPTNDLTPLESLPRPHSANTVAEDFARLITLCNLLDSKIAELRTLIGQKAAATHGHAIGDVSGLQGALDAKQALNWRPGLNDLTDVSVSGAAIAQVLRYNGTGWAPSTLSVAWGDVSGKPSSFPTAWADVANTPLSFPPDSHAHAIGDVSGLQAALDSKAGLGANSFTGDQTVGKANPALWLRKTGSGQSSFIAGTRGSIERWRLVLGDPTPETGGNAGSEFGISRFDDAGNYLGDIFRIRRSDGNGFYHGDLTMERSGAGQQPTLAINAQNAGTERPVFTLRKNGHARLQVSADGTPGAEGQVYYEATGSANACHGFFANGAEQFRIKANARFDLPFLGRNDVALTTSGSNVGDVGCPVFAAAVQGSNNPNDLNTGSNLRCSGHVANLGTTLSGTYRCLGQTTGANQATLWLRAA